MDGLNGMMMLENNLTILFFFSFVLFVCFALFFPILGIEKWHVHDLVYIKQLIQKQMNAFYDGIAYTHTQHTHIHATTQ
jgi:hypothetical protein